MDLMIRNEIIKYGNLLIDKKLTTGTGGNISYFDRNRNIMYITPSGVNYNMIEPNDICCIDYEGNVISGELKPSSEYNMHLEIYKKRVDISSVIHCHAIYATVVASAFDFLPAISYLVAHSGSNRVKVAPFRAFGSKELAKISAETLGNDYAVLLENHGINTVGSSLEQAFIRLEQLEYCCELFVKAQSCGVPKILSNEDMRVTVEAFKTYGQN